MNTFLFDKNQDNELSVSYLTYCGNIKVDSCVKGFYLKDACSFIEDNNLYSKSSLQNIKFFDYTDGDSFMENSSR